MILQKTYTVGASYSTGPIYLRVIWESKGSDEKVATTNISVKVYVAGGRHTFYEGFDQTGWDFPEFEVKLRLWDDPINNSTNPKEKTLKKTLMWFTKNNATANSPTSDFDLIGEYNWKGTYKHDLDSGFAEMQAYVYLITWLPTKENSGLECYSCNAWETLQLDTLAPPVSFKMLDGTIGKPTTWSGEQTVFDSYCSVKATFGEYEFWVGAYGYSTTETYLLKPRQSGSGEMTMNSGWYIPSILYKYLSPTAASQTCKLLVQTYIDDAVTGERLTKEAYEIEVLFYAQDNGVDIALSDYSETSEEVLNSSIDWGDNPEYFVRYVSDVEIAITASAKNYAYLAGATANGIPPTSSPGNNATSGTYVFNITDFPETSIKFRVEDSRGFSSSLTYAPGVVKYVILTNEATVRRPNPIDGRVTVTFKGNCYSGYWGLGSLNKLSILCTIVNPDTGETMYEGSPDNIELADNRYTASLSLEGYDYKTAYTVRIVVNDDLLAVPLDLVLYQGFPTFSWNRNRFMFNAPAEFNPDTDGGLKMNGHTISGVGAPKRDEDLVRLTDLNSYIPKTVTAWSSSIGLGTVLNSGDKFVFSSVPQFLYLVFRTDSSIIGAGESFLLPFSSGLDLTTRLYKQYVLESGVTNLYQISLNIDVYSKTLEIVESPHMYASDGSERDNQTVFRLRKILAIGCSGDCVATFTEG